MAKKKRKQKKKSHRFIRLNRVRAYLLIKSIKRKLKREERKIKLSS